MARFVRLHAELFQGIAYWCDTEYYEAGPGHDHVTEYYRSSTEYIASGARKSTQGVFVCKSGELGEIWLPCPDKTEFITEGPVLASVHQYGSNWDVHLQPTLSFFFTAQGAVLPLSRDDIMMALSHKIRVSPYGSFEAAREAVRAHASPYQSHDQDFQESR